MHWHPVNALASRHHPRACHYFFHHQEDMQDICTPTTKRPKFNRSPVFTPTSQAVLRTQLGRQTPSGVEISAYPTLTNPCKSGVSRLPNRTDQLAHLGNADCDWSSLIVKTTATTTTDPRCQISRFPVKITKNAKVSHQVV